jgi:hypothetical protein
VRVGNSLNRGSVEAGLETALWKLAPRWKKSHVGLLVVEGTWFCRKVFLFAKGIGSGASVRSSGVWGDPNPMQLGRVTKGVRVLVGRGEAAQVAPRTVVLDW